MRRTLHKAPCIIAGAPASGASVRTTPGISNVSLDKDQVQHIAMLARLSLKHEEFAETVEKLSRIVDFVDQLSGAPTDNVLPMAHPVNEAQRLRSDRVTESDDRDRIQQNAASVSGGLYLVPKVIE
jgi:aspartyl-tRNA(Asn)/glutamyl-tRNA(Gln) amidotransferase subunit C